MRAIGAKGTYHSDFMNQDANYQSSYERELMKYFDSKEIKWVRNKERFPYIQESKKHNYIPDFYLPDFDLYIETKGFLRANDPIKFSAFPEDKQLVLLKCEDLIKLGCNVKPIVVKDSDLNKWPLTILHRNEAWQQEGKLTEELQQKVSADKFFKLLTNKGNL